MRAYTDSDVLFGASARPDDDATSAVLEPANGTVSLEAGKYEEIGALVGIYNNVAGAKSASVQFYEYDQQDAGDDIGDDWDAVGSAVALDFGTGTAGYALMAVKNRLNFTKKFVSAIATCTIVDPGAGVTTTCQLILVGILKNRVES